MSSLLFTNLPLFFPQERVRGAVDGSAPGDPTAPGRSAVLVRGGPMACGGSVLARPSAGPRLAAAPGPLDVVLSAPVPLRRLVGSRPPGGGLA